MFDALEAINDIIDDINNDVNESYYEAICDELDCRIESGELSLEDAQIIADYAANMYIEKVDKDKVFEGLATSIPIIITGACFAVPAIIGGKDTRLNKNAVEHYADKYNISPRFEELTKKVHKLDAYGADTGKDAKLMKNRRFNVVELYSYKGKPFLAVTFTSSTKETGFSINADIGVTTNYTTKRNMKYAVYDKAAAGNNLNYYLFNTLRKHGMCTNDHKAWLGKVRQEYKNDIKN